MPHACMPHACMHAGSRRGAYVQVLEVGRVQCQLSLPVVLHLGGWLSCGGCQCLHVFLSSPLSPTLVVPLCSMCTAGSKIHNEAVALARLSADHHPHVSRMSAEHHSSLKHGGSMNSNHSHNSASSLQQQPNGSAAALPKPV